MPPSARLQVFDPDGLRQTLRLGRTPVCIGRARDCQVILDDSRISRHHCKIVRQGDRYWVTDLNSRHGTLVNGERIESRMLEPGDVIEVGVPTGFRLLFRLGGVSRGGVRGGTRRLDAHRQVSRLVLLVRAANRLLAQSVLEEALAVALETACEIIGAEHAVLCLQDARGELRPRLARGPRAESTSLEEAAAAALREAVKSGQLRVGRTPALYHKRCGPDPAGAWIVLLLERPSVVGVTDSTVLGPQPSLLGALYLAGGGCGQSLSELDEELLQSLASMVASVIENARRLAERREQEWLEGELALAGEIQRRLTPRQHTHPPYLSVAALLEPCRRLAGDCYDWVELPDESCIVMLADVAGKGPAAALVAALLRGAFAGTVLFGRPVSDVVAALNQTLLRRSGPENFATLVCARFWPDGRLESVCAGHPPLFILRRSGEVECWEHGGLPVGLFAEACYEMTSIRLVPGDRVVLVSDGVIETSVAGHELGLRGLEGLLRAVPTGTAAGVLEFLRQVVVGGSRSSEAADDRTIVVLGYHGNRPRPAGETEPPRP